MLPALQISEELTADLLTKQAVVPALVLCALSNIFYACRAI
jgi:hypothetical protein